MVRLDPGAPIVQLTASPSATGVEPARTRRSRWPVKRSCGVVAAASGVTGRMHRRPRATALPEGGVHRRGGRPPGQPGAWRASRLQNRIRVLADPEPPIALATSERSAAAHSDACLPTNAVPSAPTTEVSVAYTRTPARRVAARCRRSPRPGHRSTGHVRQGVSSGRCVGLADVHRG